jgi:hypothetical protein
MYVIDGANRYRPPSSVEEAYSRADENLKYTSLNKDGALVLGIFLGTFWFLI